MGPDRQAGSQERQEDGESLRVPPVADGRQAEWDELLTTVGEHLRETHRKETSLPSGPDLVVLYAEELVAAYQSDPEGWVAKFMAGRREESIRVLRHLAIRADSLDRYIEVLRPITAASDQDAALRSFIDRSRAEFPVDEVVAHGPGVLTDEQLARVSADSFELENLGDYLAELMESAKCGEYWDYVALADTLVLTRQVPQS